MRNRTRLEQALQLYALPLALTEQRDHIRHRMNAPDQKLARDIDIRAVAQGSRHDRLDYGEDVLDPVVEFVDHSREPALEADTHLDFALQPHVVVDDITKKSADDAGQRQPDGA